MTSRLYRFARGLSEKKARACYWEVRKIGRREREREVRKMEGGKERGK